MNEISDKLSFLSIGFSAVTFILCATSVRKIRNYLVPLMLLVTAGCIADGLNFFLSEHEVVNLFVFRAYTLVEFKLCVLFYYLFYKEYFGSYPLLFVQLPLFYIVCIIDYKLNGVDSFDNLSLSFEAVILSIHALCSFWVLMKTHIFRDLLSVPFFYINSGILLYFLGNLMFFVFSNLVLKSPPLWNIHSVLSILFNILIITAFWKSPKTV
jgi:hypothetical protein